AVGVERQIAVAERLRRLAGGEGEYVTAVVQRPLTPPPPLSPKGERGGASKGRVHATAGGVFLPPSALCGGGGGGGGGGASAHRRRLLPRQPRQPHAHVGDVHDRLAVRVHQRIDDRVRRRVVAALAHHHLVSNHLRGRRHLAAALQPARHVGHR